MNIILLEKVRNLGNLGDQVAVKSGYARNFLIPQRKAVFATTANIKKFEEQRAELLEKEQQLLDEAQKRAEQLSSVEVTLYSKAGDEGKLYGSIGTREIADAFTAKGVPLFKREIRLPEGALRMIGEHEIELSLHSDVEITVQVKVRPQE